MWAVVAVAADVMDFAAAAVPLSPISSAQDRLYLFAKRRSSRRNGKRVIETKKNHLFSGRKSNDLRPCVSNRHGVD